MHQAREIEEADRILVNGCSVRDKAVHKALSTLGQFRELKKTAESQGRKQIIGIGGCVGQLEKKALFSSAIWILCLVPMRLTSSRDCPPRTRGERKVILRTSTALRIIR